MWDGVASHTGLFPNVFPIFALGRSTSCIPSYRLILERTSTTPWKAYSFDDVPRDIPDHALVYEASICRTGEYTLGLWAPALDRFNHTITFKTIVDEDHLDTAQTQIEASDLFVTTMLTQGNLNPFHGHPELYRFGPGTTLSLRPLWALHDVAVTLLLVPFALAGWQLATTLWRHRNPAHCTNCGYELAGLPPHAPCPECGHNPTAAP